MAIGSIAASALAAESARVSTSAGNVANVNTDGFRARRTVTEATAGGGVVARTETSPAPPGPTVVDDGGAARVLSNVDLGSETVTQIVGQRAFEASLAVLRTADETTQALIDLKR